MGQVIMPGGAEVSIEELRGTASLEHLVRDLQSDDFTASYRIAVMGVIGRLGNLAASAATPLRKLIDGSDRLLRDAATQTMKQISETSPNAKTPVVSPPSPPPPPPPPHSSINYHGTGYHGLPHVRRTLRDRYEVTMTPVQHEVVLDGCSRVAECAYCRKVFDFNAYTKWIGEHIAGDNDRYCTFCLRHGYYRPEVRQNTALLTYRSLIGYIYQAQVAKNNLFLTDIKDMIIEHVAAGMSNPLFKYDYESFMWFIDLTGVRINRYSWASITASIPGQLAALGIHEILYKAKPHLLIPKISGDLVASTPGQIINPSPHDAGVPDYAGGISMDTIVDFTAKNLVEPKRLNYSGRWLGEGYD